MAQMVKTLPAMQETCVRSLGQEDPLEKEMVTCTSILDPRIPWTDEPGRLQSMGWQRVRHDWQTNTFTFRTYTWIFITLQSHRGIHKIFQKDGEKFANCGKINGLETPCSKGRLLDFWFNVAKETLFSFFHCQKVRVTTFNLINSWFPKGNLKRNCARLHKISMCNCEDRKGKKNYFHHSPQRSFPVPNMGPQR